MKDLEAIYKRIMENDGELFIPIENPTGSAVARCALLNPEIENFCDVCKYKIKHKSCVSNKEIVEMIKKELRKERLGKLLSK